MTFWADERAVTVQVGTVLLFATLIVAMSLYQATAIPSQNAEIEFRHSEQIQGQMQDVRNAVVRTGATGTSRPISVTLGTQYPSRMFFINPPPSSGTLRTVNSGTVGIENVTARSPETADYLDSSRTNLSFSTRSLVYAPNYNQYDNAPDTVLENAVVYNRADEGNATLTGQQLVHGRSITLVTLDGSLSESQSATMSIDPRALSPSTTEIRSIPVRSNGDGNVTIRVSTGLNEEKWNDLLANQMVSEPEGYVADVSVENGILRLTLLGTDASGQYVTYDLRMAKVGIGAGGESSQAHYVTSVSGTGMSVSEGSQTQLAVEVRDTYNNPVSGASVNVTLADSTPGTSHELDNGTETGQTVRMTTGSDGIATFSYHLQSVPGSSDDVEVRTSIDDVPSADGEFDTERKETLAFDVTAVGRNGNGGNGPPDDGPPGGDGSAGDIEYVSDSGLAKANGGQTTGAQFQFENTGSETVTVTDMKVSVESGPPKVIHEQAGGSSGDGQNEIYVEATESGYLEMGGWRDSQNPSAAYELGTKASLTGNAEIGGGSTATAYLFEFKKQNRQPAEMSGREVTVMLYFADGSSKDVTLTAEDPWR